MEPAVPQFSVPASCCGGKGGPWAGWGLDRKKVGHLPLGCGLQPRNTSHPQRCSWKQNSRERPILASHQDMLAGCRIRATLGELWDPRSQRMLRTQLSHLPPQRTPAGKLGVALEPTPPFPDPCQVPSPTLSTVCFPLSTLVEASLLSQNTSSLIKHRTGWSHPCPATGAPVG